jgi:hypothetical protein
MFFLRQVEDNTRRTNTSQNSEHFGYGLESLNFRFVFLIIISYSILKFDSVILSSKLIRTFLSRPCYVTFECITWASYTLTCHYCDTFSKVCSTIHSRLRASISSANFCRRFKWINLTKDCVFHSLQRGMITSSKITSLKTTKLIESIGNDTLLEVSIKAITRSKIPFNHIIKSLKLDF